MHISDALGLGVYEKIKPMIHRAFAGENTLTEFTDAASAHRIRAAFTPDTRGGAYVLSTDVTLETQTRVALQQTSKRELAAQVTSGLAHDRIVSGNSLQKSTLGHEAQRKPMKH